MKTMKKKLPRRGLHYFLCNVVTINAIDGPPTMFHIIWPETIGVYELGKQSDRASQPLQFFRNKQSSFQQ